MHIFLEIICFQFFFESLHFFCWTSTHTTRNVIFITREPHIKTKTKRPPPLPLARCCCCCCCWQHHIVRMVSGSRALSLTVKLSQHTVGRERSLELVLSFALSHSLLLLSLRGRVCRECESLQFLPLLATHALSLPHHCLLWAALSLCIALSCAQLSRVQRTTTTW